MTESSSTSSTGTPFRLPPPGSPAERELGEQPVEQARAEGVDLVGPGGLLGDLTERVLEAGLEDEMTDHLGYHKHDPAGRDGGNSRNGTRSKTVITEVGPVSLDAPRDRDGSFEPNLVAKRQRRLRCVDEMVISLTATGLTTGEVQAHLAELYGTEVSRETVSKITDAILGEMTEWMTRLLERVYPVVFIDALFVKVRDGQVTNRPIYTAIGVTVDGRREILGLWAGTGGEGAKFWLQVLTEIKNRGTEDVCMVVCDGLKGLPDAIDATWPLAVVQTCVLHLIRNTFRLASRRDWDAMARDLRPVYTAPTEAAANERLGDFHDTWGETYPGHRDLWDNAWAEFVPFLDYSPEIRRAGTGDSRRSLEAEAGAHRSTVPGPYGGWGGSRVRLSSQPSSVPQRSAGRPVRAPHARPRRRVWDTRHLYRYLRPR